MSTDRARFEYKMTPELKEKLRKRAEAEGRPMNELLNEIVHSHLEEGQENSEQKELEREFEKVNKQLNTLEEKNQTTLQRSVTILQNVQQRYPTLHQDFKRIRLQAVSDYRKDPNRFSNEVGFRSERDIDEVCQLAEQLHELKSRKAELETRLGGIYGIEVHQPIVTAPVEKKDEPEYVFRVELTHDDLQGWWVTRYNVPDVPPIEGLKPFPFTFPDGRRGLVFEARPEEYPEPKLIDGKWVDPYQSVAGPWMMRLDENTGSELRKQLKQSRKHYEDTVRDTTLSEGQVTDDSRIAKHP